MKKTRTLSSSILTLSCFLTVAALIWSLSIANPSDVSAAGCPNPPPGSVSWWPGDGNANDIVGTNNGTMMNGATFAAGVVGQAFSLDGVDDYVQVASPANLPLGNAPRTIDVWFKTPRDLTAWTESCIVQYGAANYYQMFGLITSANAPGKLYFYGHGSDLSGTTTIQPDTWYHGAVTYDGSTLRLYVNGQLEASAPMSLSTVLDGNGLTIGYRHAGSRWEGLIDEVGIFDRAFTSQEIAAIYNAGSAGKCKPVCPPPSDLVSWWSGDGHLFDLIGTNNGTMMNGATYADGKVVKAFNFTGAEDSFVEIANHPSLNPSGAFTIDGWFYIDPAASGNAGEIATLVSKSEGSAGNGWALYFDDRDSSKSLKFILGSYTILQNAILAPNWYHIAGVFDPSARPQTKLYLNGVNVADSGGQIISAVSSNGLNVRIGAMYWTDYYHQGNDRLNGKADEVEFFNRALTAEEIAAIHSAGSAGKCKPCFAPPSDMVSWWTGDGNANDILGANNGTLQNGASYAEGKVGQAFSLDGVDDYITIPYSSDLDLQGAFSIDAWVKPQSFGPGTTLVVGKAGGYQIYLHSDGRVNISSYDGATWALLDSLSTLPLANWSHVAGTFDPVEGVMTLYINGQSDASVSTSLIPAANTNDLEIGGFSCCGSFFSGLIDEVEIFNRALTAEEIAAIHTAGSAGKCIPPDTTPDSFTFIDQDGVSRNTVVESNVITVTGINTAAPVSITGGEYSIGGGEYTSAPGTVENGQTVRVRQTSANSYSTTTDATLMVGGVSDIFSVTTMSIPMYSITGSAPGGHGAISCDSPVTEGSNSTCTMTPDTGYHLSGLTDNGNDVFSLVVGSTYTIPNVTSNHDVVGVFAINTYTIATSVPGDHGTLSCASPVNYGANSVCTITPDTGYLLKSLTDNGTDVISSVSGNTYTIVNVTANHTVTGAFAHFLVNPKEGTIGTIVEIKGPGFGAKKGKVVLQSGGVTYALKVLEWNVGGSGVIKAQLTKAIVGGALCNVVVYPKEPKGVLPITETGAFAVKKPEVTELSASGGKIGATITITGQFLGYKKGKVLLEDKVTHARKSCKVLSWPTTPGAGTGTGQIQFVVPKMALATYNLVLQNKVGEDVSESFTVLP